MITRLKSLSLQTNDQHNTYRWQSTEALLADSTVHTHVKWYFEKNMSKYA